ncbi:sulfatase-like hydrolase/transferase [Rhodoferax saidenbachensis]|uniref:Sulfatase n=1 Tax=Rhodoferax saidenbachensis TaxID=1484693 RepID=A0A1P8KFZ1_9BURK|nr:sulfatase-like hydrolase/transferase [Rhodoferax saidenbachensis]APW44822.1 sulfatase [Rhodoferax saidenbachensis]
MTLRKRLGITALVLLGAVALLYVNRIELLKYSLGWYTDIRFPREPNKPVPWMAGPDQADKPVGQRPPNIIVILADDMGINDVSTRGGGHTAEGVPTPNIDSIARDGVRFDQGYAGAAVCTVSRAALMTGRYPWRFGVEFTPTPGAMSRVAPALYGDTKRLYPVIVDKEKAEKSKDFNDLGMPASEITVAEALKARGYHTVHIGKWHLGSTPEMRPNNQGFDETLFMESGLHLPVNSPDVENSRQDFDPIDKFLWPNMRFGVSYNGGKWFEPAKYLADYYTDEAINAIQKNKNRPFFMYLAHWGVHTPLQASKEDYDALSNIPDHRRRVYAAMVRSIDRSVGRVLQTLKDQGLEENTIVIFASDNGAPGYIGLPDVNKPYRGWKLTMFEGGLRVPYVAKWPGHIAAGTQYQPPISNIDIMPTVLAAAGGTLPTDRPIDGVNLLPYLTAKPATQPPRPLYWRDGPYQAMQENLWKLIVSERPKKEWLFNLANDPTEKTNLTGEQPQKLAQMKAQMAAHHATMPPSMWPSFIELPIEIDKTLDQVHEPSDEYVYWYN